MSNSNQAKYICIGRYVLEIFSDASLTGSDASCRFQRSHGWWSKNDRVFHINALELKATFLALKCFATNHQNCEILLRLDNTTTISYINRFSSVQYPLLSRDIWQCCERRKIFLFASYIASAENIIADRESRRLDADTEWSLSTEAFDTISEIFRLFEIDLFALLLNTLNVNLTFPGCPIRTPLQWTHLHYLGNTYISMHFLLLSSSHGYYAKSLTTRQREY